MKAFLTYWIIGCFVIGMPMGEVITECPNAKIRTSDVVGMVAAWPVVFAMAIARIGKPPLPDRGCGAVQ